MSLVDAAERSTLGALLHTPGSVGQVSCWLHGWDFLHPRNAIAFELISELGAATRCGPVELLTAARGRDDARRNQIDGPFVHDLLRAPGSVDRAAVYGRLVLQASVHRQVVGHGLRLHQVATGPDVDGIRWPLAQVDRAGEALAALAHRVLLAGLPGDDAPQAAPGQCPRGAVTGRRHRRERAALSALLASPAALHDVGTWLRPDDFGAPAHAATFASMRSVHGRGEPVEPLTVAWPAERRDRTLTLSELRAMSGRPAVGTARAACLALLELRLWEGIAAAAVAMVLTGVRPDLGAHAVLSSSRSHLAQLDSLRERLNAACGQTRGALPVRPGPSTG